MSDVNEVRLVGNIGRDPEVRFTGNGNAVANFTVATKYKDKTEWHRIVAWGDVAESAGKMAKGNRVEVNGYLQTREWTIKEGVKQYTTEIVARSLSADGARGDQRANAATPGGGDVFPPYGRSKGAPIAGASMGDLEFYANGARRSLADQSKARFHANERALLAAIEAEIARQSGGGGNRDFGPPPPGFDDPEPSRGGSGGRSGAPDEDDIPFAFIETRADRA